MIQTYIQEITSKGTASPADRIKASVRSICLEKWDCRSPSINTKLDTKDEAADVFHKKAVRDWFYDDRDSHLLNIPITQVMGNAAVKGGLFPQAPCITLLLQNQGTVHKALLNLLLLLPLMGLRMLIKILGQLTKDWEEVN